LLDRLFLHLPNSHRREADQHDGCRSPAMESMTEWRDFRLLDGCENMGGEMITGFRCRERVKTLPYFSHFPARGALLQMMLKVRQENFAREVTRGIFTEAAFIAVVRLVCFVLHGIGHVMR